MVVKKPKYLKRDTDSLPIMNCTKADQAGVVDFARKFAGEKGMNPDDIADIVHASFRAYQTSTDTETEVLYKNLNPQDFYVESKGRTPLVKKDTESSKRNFNDLVNRVNEIFSETLSAFEQDPRGIGKAYFWLEKLDAKKGALYTFGRTHQSDNRPNMHYVEVLAGYEKLVCVLNSIVDNPDNAARFLKISLGWESPNLFEELDTMVYKTPGDKKPHYRNASLIRQRRSE